MRPALGWLAAALGYFALARLSSQVELVREGVPLIVFSQGAAYAAVQLGGPWFAAAVAAGAAGEGFSEGLPTGSVLLFAAAAAAAGLAGLAVTRSVRLGRPDGERLIDTLVRTGAGIVAGLVAGSFLLAANAVDGRMHDAPTEWMLLVLANVAGIVVVAPFVRAWADHIARGVARAPEWIALIAVSIAASVSVDSGVLGKIGPTAYIMVSIVIWGALRCGRMGMTAVVVISAVIAAEWTAAGVGPFVVSSLRESAVSLDTFLIVLGLSGLLVVGIE